MKRQQTTIHSKPIKYKITFIYPDTPKALPIVNFVRQDNAASFYLTDLNKDVWEKIKKLAYSEQVHPCPWKNLVLVYKVYEYIEVSQSWNEVNIKDYVAN
jgi:hypothetical protein